MTRARLSSRAMPARWRVGADEVAAALAGGARRRNLRSRSSAPARAGFIWLEPMVEVETPRAASPTGRCGADDVEACCAGLLDGGAHPLRLGPPEEIPCLKRQTRLTFARCGIVDPLSLDDYRAHGG